MPSVKRRMNLTLPDELAEAFDDFRAATGSAPASFVVEILMQAIPMIKSVSHSVRLAQQGNLEAFDVLNNSLSGALQHGASVQQDMLEKSSALRRARSDSANPPSRKRRKFKSKTPVVPIDAESWQQGFDDAKAGIESSPRGDTFSYSSGYLEGK